MTQTATTASHCPKCDRAHLSLTGRPVPFCSAHVDPRAGACDVMGSHICGPSEIELAIADMWAGAVA